MSGPKCSNFRIEQERRERLERERRMAQLTDERKRLTQDLQNIGVQIKKLGENVINEATPHFSSSYFYQTLIALKETSKNRLKDTLSISPGSTIDEIQANNKLISIKITELKRSLLELSYYEDHLIQEIKDSKQASNFFDSKIEKGVSISYDLEKVTKDLPQIKVRIERVEEEELHRQYQELHQSLTSYILSSYITKIEELQKMKTTIEQINLNKELSTEDKYQQIIIRKNAFFSTIDQLEREIEDNKQIDVEYNLLLTRYQNLKGENKEFDIERIDQRKLLFNRLRDEVRQLEEEQINKEELHYIIESVDAVMNELGYEIIAKDIMRTPAREVNHQMYRFGNEAINVFVSDNDSILFEVSGYSDGKKEMTELERQKIVEAMEGFCSQYDDILLKLEARGISMENIDRRPAKKEYARMYDISNKEQIAAKQNSNRRQQYDRKIDINKSKQSR